MVEITVTKWSLGRLRIRWKDIIKMKADGTGFELCPKVGLLICGVQLSDYNTTVS
jgi:hypothetical protein